ncbi:MAG: glycosyltransferase, partial [Kiritimatiellia bacterium]|nr:glycosyltransferase [Kiritimatiellia bacterium]
AAVKKDHKRIDYLIQEFAAFINGDLSRKRVDEVDPNQPSTINHQPYLLIVGSRQNDTDELVAMARDLAGDRIKILADVPREHMPDLYRTMDVFLLSSLFEMMPIAILEALASGLPVIVNDHPVLSWMVGVDVSADLNHPSTINHQPSRPGGAVIDMSADGELAKFLSGLTPDWIAEHGIAARERAA